MNTSTVVPVSYTHLDVYKRQYLDRAVRKAANLVKTNSNPGLTSTETNTLSHERMSNLKSDTKRIS